MATANNILSTVMGVIESPEDIALIAAFGNFLSVFAAHNKTHLGSADSAVSQTGQAITGAAGLLSALGVTATAAAAGQQQQALAQQGS